MATVKHRIINGKTLLRKKYHEVDFGEFKSLIGVPEMNCTMMFYGPSGSGKSVLALKLTSYLRNVKRLKAIYNSHEEAHNKSLQDRVNDFEIEADFIQFGDTLPFEYLIEKIKRNHYRVVVIDSVQYMQFTIDQLRELRETFKKRKIMVILLSFGDAVGKPTNAAALLHACDVKVFFKDGKAYSHGRYLKEPVTQVLFNPNKKQTSQQSLL